MIDPTPNPSRVVKNSTLTSLDGGQASSFRDLVKEEIETARDAAIACELQGHHELAQWWRWRVLDLESYLADIEPGSAVRSAA